MCKDLGIPMSEEKTEWGSACMVFLGILLDGEKFILTIPEDKCIRAQNMLDLILSK